MPAPLPPGYMAGRLSPLLLARMAPMSHILIQSGGLTRAQIDRARPAAPAWRTFWTRLRAIFA